jgi:hypothetical protein
VLNPAGLHYLLALLNVLLLALLNDLPELVGEGINPLMELILGCLVLA